MNASMQKTEKADNKLAEVRQNLLRMERDIGAILPKVMGFERLLSVTMAAVKANPTLALCERGFYSCLLSLAGLGLEPNTPLGHAYLIPRENWDKTQNKKVLECTLQLGYQGMIELAYRSGRILSVDADVAKQGDLFEWEKGTKSFIRHKRGPNWDHAEPGHVWALAADSSGRDHFRVLTMLEVDQRRLVNTGTDGKNSPWVKWFDEMAKKTALRAALKYAPKSVEVQRAIQLEDASHDGTIASLVEPRLMEAMERNRIIDAEATVTEELPQGAGAKAAAKARRPKQEPVVEQRRPQQNEAQASEETADVWDRRFMEAGNCDLESARRYRAEGYEIEGGKLVPPVGGGDE